MPSQYDTNTKAQVIADARLGKTGRQIARQRMLPERTVYDWLTLVFQGSCFGTGFLI